MAKKYVIVVIMVIVVLAGGLILLRRTRMGKISEADNLKNLAEQTNQISRSVDQAIDDLDTIDESEDSIDKLEQILKGISEEPTPISTVDTSILDALLSEADKADLDAEQAINDFSAIDESEDDILKLP